MTTERERIVEAMLEASGLGDDFRGRIVMALDAALPLVLPEEPSEAAKEIFARKVCGYGDLCFGWDEPVGSSYGNDEVNRKEMLADGSEVIAAAFAARRKELSA